MARSRNIPEARSTTLKLSGAPTVFYRWTSIGSFDPFGTPSMTIVHGNVSLFDINTEYSHTIVAWWLSGIRRGYFYGYCEGLVSK